MPTLRRLLNCLPIWPPLPLGVVNATDVDDFSDGVLQWWRTDGHAFPAWAWAAAARVAFAFSPNSASCERVFSLLRVMYGVW